MAVTVIDQQFDPCIFEFKLCFSVGTIDIPIITQLSFLRNCSENCSDKLPELRKTSNATGAADVYGRNHLR